MKYNIIQVCRGIAAFLVVLFHLGGAIAAEKYFNLPNFSIPFSFGYTGVYFFFVLSGFIITFAHSQDFSKPDRFFRYVKKRVFRIYPVYWVIFAGVFMLGMALPEIRAGLPTDPQLLLTSLSLLPQDRDLVGGTGAPVLIVAWSLQYEIVFYAIFGALILSARLTLIAIVTFLIYSFYCHFTSSPCSLPLQYLQWDYLLLFAAGSATAFLHGCKNLRPRPMLTIVIGGLLFTCVAGLLVGKKLVPELNLPLIEAPVGTLLYGLASCLLLLGLVQLEDAGREFSWRWPILLGEASYSLYLIHFPLISALCKVALLVGLSGIAGAFLAYFTILGLCVIVSVIFYRSFEKPLLRTLSRHHRVPKAT